MSQSPEPWEILVEVTQPVLFCYSNVSWLRQESSDISVPQTVLELISRWRIHLGTVSWVKQTVLARGGKWNCLSSRYWHWVAHPSLRQPALGPLYKLLLRMCYGEWGLISLRTSIQSAEQHCASSQRKKDIFSCLYQCSQSLQKHFISK